MGNNLGLTALISLALVIVVVGLIAAFGSDVTSDIQADFTTDSYEYNATQNALEGVSETTERLDTIAVVVVAGIIITVLVAAFAFVMRR